jgi:hypothetical protein
MHILQSLFILHKNNHQHLANPIIKPHRYQARLYFDPHEVPWGCLASCMQRFPNQYNKTHIICILFLVDVTTQNDKEDGHNSLK